MDVAVGRLQFSVRLANAQSVPVDAPPCREQDPVETAFRRDRIYRELQADRERWANDAVSRGVFR